jgi:hypothetical protein
MAASIEAGSTREEIETEAEVCPHCRAVMQILLVRFRFSGTKLLASCPNCAMVSREDGPTDARKSYSRISKAGEIAMDQLSLRAWYVLGILFAALITAAFLRHGLHVYAGFERDEIRAYAVIALAGVLVAAIGLRRRKQNSQ